LLSTDNMTKRQTEEYYRRVKGLEASAQVFEATAEPEEVLEWAQRFERYLETGLIER
jgi:hypothetical protein